MKQTIFAVLCVALLAACTSSTTEQYISPEQRELIRRNTLDELKQAQNSAFRDGIKFAKAALLTKRSQCNTEVSEDRRLQSPVNRKFRDETKPPFINGCINGARANVRQQQLEKQARVAEKTRLAAAARKGANKK